MVSEQLLVIFLEFIFSPCSTSKYTEITKNVYRLTSVQFWMYFKNYFYFFTQMCTKRFANMCAKILENILTDFFFMVFTSNWHQLGKVYMSDSGVIGLKFIGSINRALNSLAKSLLTKQFNLINFSCYDKYHQKIYVNST